MSKNHIKKVFVPIIFLSVVFGVISIAQATGITVSEGSSIDTIPKFLEWIINVFLIGVMGIAAFVAILVGGFMILMAGPDPAKAETGKKTLIYAIGGLVIAALSYSFMANIVNILNSIF